MDQYNNIPPYPNQPESPNNQNGPQANYTPPVRHPGSGFAFAALILGLLSILTAFLGTVYPPFLFGGLAIILAILSKGMDRKLLTNAKAGLITGIVGLVVNVVVMTASLILFFTNPQMQEAVFAQIDQTYEMLYGESFEEAFESMYGEEFSDIWEEMMKGMME